MNRHMALLAVSACVGLFLMGCQPEAERGSQDAEAADAPATERPVSTPYETWDANRDRVLQRDEFAQWRNEQGLFDDWIGEEGLDREVASEEIRARRERGRRRDRGRVAHGHDAPSGRRGHLERLGRGR